MRSTRSPTLLAAGLALLVLGGAVLLWRSESALSSAPAGVAHAQTAPPGAGPADPLGSADSDLPPAAAGRSCSVHGRVLDHQGRGLPSLTVELHLGRELRLAQTDAEGRFAFRGLQRGLYRLSVDAASLPSGMHELPTWKQQPERHEADLSSELAGTAFRLLDDSDPEVELRVFLAGTVRGRVLEASGKPIVNAAVGIQTAEGIHDTARTDVAGRFVFEEAYPGTGVTSVDLSQAMAVEVSAPLPVPFELAPGGSVVLDDLVAGVGGHVLRGTVTDLAGQPVAGLGLLCQEEADVLYRLRWKATTDANGRFELGRVPSTALVLSVGADDRDLPPQSRLLAENVAPIRVDTRSAAETLELPAIMVAARHPFHVRGRVLIETQWALAEQLDPRQTPRVEVRERGEASARPVALVPRAESARPDDGAAFREGTFDWSCATPHAEIEFRAVIRKQDGTEIERLTTVIPSADGTQDLLLRFP